MDAFSLRRAQPDDAMAIAKVHVRSWQVGYRGLLPDDYLASLKPEERVSRYTFGHDDPTKPDTILAFDGDTLLGFVTTGPAWEATGGAGHLMALYVDPDYWQRGVGRTLLARGREELAARGYREGVLWVLANNERAQRFYSADGWAFDGHEDYRTLWGITVRDRRYRRPL